MIELGYIESTVKYDATDTAGGFTVPGTAGARKSYVAIADVALHLARNGTATQDSMLVPANTLVSVQAFAGDTVSIIKDTDADDGNVWFTLTDR
jgi:hypothetical protein